MIHLLSLVLLALQNGAPVHTALGRPVLREGEPVLLLQRGAASRVEFSALWTLQEKLDLAEVPSTEGRRFAASAVQYDTVLAPPAQMEAALQSVPRLESPLEMPLPRDGRLMLVWDRTTGAIDVQMAASAAVPAEGESLDCPRIAEREVGFITERAATSTAVMEGDSVRITPTVRAGDPTPRLHAFSILRPLGIEEVLDQPKPRKQVSLGFFELLATGERVEDVPQYRCTFSSWRDEPGARELCVAQSADGLRWYLWFDGAMPE